MDDLIRSGIPWFDNRGETVNAHGACILEYDGLYYLFGEYKADEGNAFGGISCYSSADLVNWTFERIALPVQNDGLLGPARIGERPKVMRCPSTGQFVMYMHSDDLGYRDPHVGVATSDTINGEYAFQGALLHGGEPIRRWDLGTFQDRDGTGYLLAHEGDIFRLSEDYLQAEEQVASSIAEGGESPAMLEHDGQYFLIFSNKTTWERNDNYYLSAPSIAGPWAHRGLLAPEGTLTHNSQSTFVLKMQRDGRTQHMYMGDRWSFPRQASSATYVWLPLNVGADGIALPERLEAWAPGDANSPADSGSVTEVSFVGKHPNAALEVQFNGRQVGIEGRTNVESGYALVEILGTDGETKLATYVDWYSLVESSGLRFLSPELPDGQYRLRVTPTGEMSVCFNKAGDRFGSTDSFISVTRIVSYN